MRRNKYFRYDPVAEKRRELDKASRAEAKRREAEVLYGCRFKAGDRVKVFCGIKRDTFLGWVIAVYSRSVKIGYIDIDGKTERVFSVGLGLVSLKKKKLVVGVDEFVDIETRRYICGQ